MDREQFRKQITQRYVAGKAMDGASADQIARGVLDPVEQMNYLSAKSGSPKSTEGDGFLGFFIFLVLILLGFILLFLRIIA